MREQKELLKQKSEQDQWKDLISLQENFAGNFVQKFAIQYVGPYTHTYIRLRDHLGANRKKTGRAVSKCIQNNSVITFTSK